MSEATEEDDDAVAGAGDDPAASVAALGANGGGSNGLSGGQEPAKKKRKKKAGAAAAAAAALLPSISSLCNPNEQATMTEPDRLGPCSPGTAVKLQGIVWQETDKGKETSGVIVLLNRNT